MADTNQTNNKETASPVNTSRFGGLRFLSERLLGGLFQLLRPSARVRHPPASPRASPRSSSRPYSRRSTPKASPVPSAGRNGAPSTKPLSRPSPKPSSRSSRRSPINESATDRISHRDRLRSQRKNFSSRRTLMPWLSDVHLHSKKKHENCFAAHLVDAVKLHKFINDLKKIKKKVKGFIWTLNPQSSLLLCKRKH